MLGGINSAGENGFYPPFNIACIIQNGRCSLLVLHTTVASCLALEIIVLVQSPSSTTFTPSILLAKRYHQGNCHDSLTFGRLS